MDNGASSYRRFLDGDDKGLTEIVKEYKDGLTLYLNSFVNNIYTAEELMEETFFKLITKRPRFSEKYSFKTWLYTIGRNAAIDYIRHHSRLYKTPADETENYLSDENDLEKSYIAEERKFIVHRALKKAESGISPDFMADIFEDFSLSEAGAVMKKNARQVKNLVYQAKNALKTELDKEDFIYEEL